MKEGLHPTMADEVLAVPSACVNRCDGDELKLYLRNIISWTAINQLTILSVSGSSGSAVCR